MTFAVCVCPRDNRNAGKSVEGHSTFQEKIKEFSYRGKG